MLSSLMLNLLFSLFIEFEIKFEQEIPYEGPVVVYDDSVTTTVCEFTAEVEAGKLIFDDLDTNIIQESCLTGLDGKTYKIKSVAPTPPDDVRFDVEEEDIKVLFLTTIERLFTELEAEVEEEVEEAEEEGEAS